MTARTSIWAAEPVAPEDLVVRTERLVVSAVTTVAPDAYLRFLTRNRAHIAEYMPDEILEMHTPAEVEAWLAQLREAWLSGEALCVVARCADGPEPVVQLYVAPMVPAAGVVELGYFVDAPYEGRGLVSEAVRAVCRLLFDAAGVKKVVAVCDLGNLASARVAERAGFRQEGVLRQHGVSKDGAGVDRRVFGLLATDPV